MGNAQSGDEGDGGALADGSRSKSQLGKIEKVDSVWEGDEDEPDYGIFSLVCPGCVDDNTESGGVRRNANIKSKTSWVHGFGHLNLAARMDSVYNTMLGDNSAENVVHGKLGKLKHGTEAVAGFDIDNCDEDDTSSDEESEEGKGREVAADTQLQPGQQTPRE